MPAWESAPLVGESEQKSAPAWASAPLLGEPQKAPETVQKASNKAGGYGTAANVAGGLVEPVLALGSGMLAKPAGDVVGLAGLGLEGLRRMGLPIEERNPLEMQRSVQNALSYDPRTSAGQAVSEYNPLTLMGKGVNWLGSKAEELVAPTGLSGPMQSALGYGAHEIVNQLPMLLGTKSPTVASGVKNVLSNEARDVMQSALKPPLAALEKGEAGRAITTLLDEGINVSRGGVEKMRGRVDALNDTIKSYVQDSPAMVDKYVVAARLGNLVDRFEKQVAPLSDVVAIQKVWDEFINHPLLNGDGMRSAPIANEARGQWIHQSATPIGPLRDQPMWFSRNNVYGGTAAHAENTGLALTKPLLAYQEGSLGKVLDKWEELGGGATDVAHYRKYPDEFGVSMPPELQKALGSLGYDSVIQRGVDIGGKPWEWAIALKPQSQVLSRAGDSIPVPLAQELKQGTYRALGDKSYGELKGAEIEAQKALARGLKEEIANAVPAVRELNAQESNLLNALSLTERRVLISANKNPMGLGWLTTNPVKFAGFMADRSELFKSLVARMLNKTSKATPDMTTAGPIAGAAITGEANEQK